MPFDNGLWEEQEEPVTQAYRQSLNLETHIYAGSLPSNQRLNSRSYQLSCILLICLIFGMKEPTVGGRMTGEGQWALNMLACQQLVSDHITERKALFKSVHPSCFLSLPAPGFSL